MNLQEIKTNMETGVIVSKPTWVAVVDHALMLTEQRNRMARLISEQLAPKYVTDSNGPDAWVCQCCLGEAKGSPHEAPNIMAHDRDCLYVEALKVHNSAIAQHSEASAFGIDKV